MQESLDPAPILAPIHPLPDSKPDVHHFINRSKWGFGNVPESFHAFAEEADGRLLAGSFARFDCGRTLPRSDSESHVEVYTSGRPAHQNESKIRLG